jgi:hypothetical protein
MKYHTQTSVEPEFVRITTTGEYVFEEMFPFLTHIRSECKRTDRNRALVDCSQIIGDLAEVERFAGGQKVAELFGKSIKVALIMPPSQITKLGELAAVNRGAVFLVTHDADEALEWLLKN